MKYTSFAVLAVLCVLSACSSRDSLEGRGPDEYLTMSNPPLILPPDFTLRAPVPAEAGTAMSPQQKQVKKALDMPQKTTTTTSDGERALLKQTGTGDPDIRDQLATDAKKTDDDTPVLDKALKTDKTQTTVNPEQEAAKLQKNGIKTTGRNNVRKATAQ